MPTSFLLTLASPRGRLPRGDWCGRLALLSIACLAFGMLALSLAGNDGAALVALLWLWGAGALSTRRLHDIGRGGKSLLLVLIPVLGPLWLLFLLLRPGVDGRNRHGDDPLSRRDYLRVDIAN